MRQNMCLKVRKFDYDYFCIYIYVYVHTVEIGYSDLGYSDALAVAYNIEWF
jgi:hypothetical protein